MKIILELTPEDTYALACFYTGRVHSDLPEEQIHIVISNLNKLIEHLDDEYRREYLDVVAQFNPASIAYIKECLDNPNTNIIDLLKRIFE